MYITVSALFMKLEFNYLKRRKFTTVALSSVGIRTASEQNRDIHSGELQGHIPVKIAIGFA